MIKDFNRQMLKMDFSNINTHQPKQPSDIDMLWIDGTHRFVIFGEIKNGVGDFNDNQKALYEFLAEAFSTKYDVYVLYITHSQFVEKGDNKVDVSASQVEEYLYRNKEGKMSQWTKPKRPITVQQAFDIIITRK